MTLSLLTIISEAVLKERLVEDVLAAGAKGYTVSECQGEGARHRRVSEILGGNIKLEVIVTPTVAEQLLEKLAAEYFPNYAVIAYVAPVSVVRGEKYV